MTPVIYPVLGLCLRALCGLSQTGTSLRARVLFFIHSAYAYWRLPTCLPCAEVVGKAEAALALWSPQDPELPGQRSRKQYRRQMDEDISEELETNMRKSRPGESWEIGGQMDRGNSRYRS